MDPSRTGVATNESLLDQSSLIVPVATYLSASLVRCRLRNRSAPAVIGEYIEGALLFADISGFTTLSQQLARHGNEGAEELTVLLNEYFQVMVDIIIDHGGDILQFGGDSLLTVFGPSVVAPNAGEDSVDQRSVEAQSTPASSVFAAIRCGLEMQSGMQRFQRLQTSVGTSRLSMSMAVHCGRFLLASAGSWAGRLQQVVMGRTLNRLAEVEAIAESGELLLTAEAERILENRVLLKPARKDCFRAIALTDCAEPLRPADRHPRGALEELAEVETAAALEMLQPYLIPAVYRRIVDDPSGYGNDGEHRFIATMFVHFDDMSEVMAHFWEDSPMDAARILDAYLAAMTQTITRHGGALARVSAEPRGDKLLVLFGAPVAVENPEQRAVRCALEMNERLKELNAGSKVTLRQRIGITSGSAFCGNVGSACRREYTVIGDQVNTAARLMIKAEPAEILASGDVWQKTHKSFHFGSRTPVRLKGKEHALDVYPVLSPREPRQPTPAKRRTLVGRTAECERFRQTASTILDGKGQLLSIRGEAGVGKSRLTSEFVAHCRDLGMRGLRGHCQAYGTSVPYLPWAEILRDIADIRRRDSADVCRQKLETKLTDADPELAAWSPLLGTVVGTPIPDNLRTASLTPRQRKEKMFAVCVELLRAWAREGPAFLVLEDVHWIDPLSRDLLVYLSSRLLDYPVLMLVTQRSEFEPPEWSVDTPVSSIELSTLSSESAVEMLEMLLGTKAVSEDLVRLVLEKTQGNPFYVEEMVLALREAKNLVWDQTTESYELIRDAKAVDLPGTIQGVILSRLDRLPEEQRRMLQVASVFGRNFPRDVLRTVLPFQLTPETMESKLQEVARLELIGSAHPQSSPSYAFRHALVQEVAYESLSYARRREIHRAIGEALEREYKDEANEQSDVLARHFDLGRASEKAAKYLVIAGDKAKRVYANTEAADYYERALDHLRALGKEVSPHLIARVLEELADVRSLTGDYAAAVNCYREASELVEGSVECARLEGKLGGVCYRQGQPHAGIKHLELGLGHLGIRAPRTRWQVRVSLPRQILIQAAHTMWPAMFIRQRSKNREATRAAIEIYESLVRISFEFDVEKCLDAHLRQLNLCETIPRSPEMAQTYSSHGVVCGIIPSFARAIRYQRRGLAIREAEGSRWGVAQSLNFMGVNYYCMGRWEQSLSCLEKSVRIFDEVGDCWESEVTYVFLSLGCMRKGDLELAVQHARTGLDQSRRAKDSQGMGWAFRALAEATSRQGKLAEALEYGRQALESSEEARDRMWVAVVRRALGEIHLRMGNRQQAIQEMERSLEQIRKYGLRHEFVMGAYPGLAEAYLSVLDDDQDRTARRAALRRIRKLCRQAVSKGKKFPNWLGYAYRVSALCERAAGRPQAARRFFERSLDSSRSLGARYELGVTHFEMGKFLLESGDPDASDCLNEAIRLFKECGAELDREGAETTMLLRSRIGGRHQAAPGANLLARRITEEGQST